MILVREYEGERNHASSFRLPPPQHHHYPCSRVPRVLRALPPAENLGAILGGTRISTLPSEGLRGSTCRTRSQSMLPSVMQLRRCSLFATICYSSILKSISFITFLEVPSLIGLAVEGRRKALLGFCGVRHSEITPMCIRLRVGNDIYLTDTAYWAGWP